MWLVLKKATSIYIKVFVGSLKKAVKKKNIETFILIIIIK